MKKSFYIILLCFSVFVFSQETNNRFQQNDHQNSGDSYYETQYASPSDPPDDDDPPVPIDDYIPLLAITAAGLIVCYSRKRIIITKS